MLVSKGGRWKLYIFKIKYRELERNVVLYKLKMVEVIFHFKVSIL